MHKLLTVTAAALALTLSAGASFAVPLDDQEDNTADVFNAEPAPSTTFDLGIDVSGVPQSPGAVKSFLGSLAPDTRGILLSTCQHYMQNPVSARDQDTIAFCSAAVGG